MDLLFHPQHIHKMDKCCFPGTHELLVCLAPYKKGNKIKSLCIRDNFGDLYNVDYLSEMVPQAHSNRVENGHVTAATIFILLSLFFIHLLNSRLIKVIPNKREREREIERERGRGRREIERESDTSLSPLPHIQLLSYSPESLPQPREPSVPIY